MKRKYLDVPANLQSNQYPSAINDLEQFVLNLKSGKKIKKSKFTENILSVLWNETLNRNIHLRMPIDIVKKILVHLKDNEAMWMVGRLLNKKTKKWIESIMDVYTIRWLGLKTVVRKSYFIRRDVPRPIELIFYPNVNIQFSKFILCTTNFKVQKNKKTFLDSKNMADLHNMNQKGIFLMWERDKGKFYPTKRARGYDKLNTMCLRIGYTKNGGG